jgi:hypothetical protein
MERTKAARAASTTAAAPWSSWTARSSRRRRQHGPAMLNLAGRAPPRPPPSAAQRQGGGRGLAPPRSSAHDDLPNGRGGERRPPHLYATTRAAGRSRREVTDPAGMPLAEPDRRAGRRVGLMFGRSARARQRGAIWRTAWSRSGQPLFPSFNLAPACCSAARMAPPGAAPLPPGWMSRRHQGRRWPISGPPPGRARCDGSFAPPTADILEPPIKAMESACRSRARGQRCAASSRSCARAARAQKPDGRRPRNEIFRLWA